MASEKTNRLRILAVKSFYFRAYLFWNLPMGFLSGMKIKKLNEDQCIVTVPFKWINKNPFKSTFWAVLGMAGEMSTAALILQYTYKQKPSFSTLPLKCEADFNKKAIEQIAFLIANGTDETFKLEIDKIEVH